MDIEMNHPSTILLAFIISESPVLVQAPFSIAMQAPSLS
jgi:hypothetical protein